MNKLILMIFIIQIVVHLNKCQPFSEPSSQSSNFKPTTNSPTHSFGSLIVLLTTKYINESCVNNSQCFYQLKCVNNVCQCDDGYIWLELTKHCDKDGSFLELILIIWLIVTVMFILCICKCAECLCPGRFQRGTTLNELNPMSYHRFYTSSDAPYNYGTCNDGTTLFKC